MDSRQKAESCHHLVRTLGNGEYADAYISLPKSSANQIISDFSSGLRSKEATLAMLRGILEVTKVSTQNATHQNTSSDIDREVEVLTYLQSIHQHPNLIELVDAVATADGRKTWYTMRPVCRGGNIERLCNEALQGQLPAGLVWHIAYQLVSIVLYLHFGSHEASPEAKTDWPFISHGDMNPGNMLFQLPPATSPTRTGDYPNLILIDFGKSCLIKQTKERAEIPSSPSAAMSPPSPGTVSTSEASSPQSPKTTTAPTTANLSGDMQASRTGDLTSVLYWLTSLEQSLCDDDSVKSPDGKDSDEDSDDRRDDSEDREGPFGRALGELESLDEKPARDIYRVLRVFQKLAADMRDGLYENLDDDLLEFFGAHYEDVTDGELAGMFPMLKR